MNQSVQPVGAMVSPVRVMVRSSLIAMDYLLLLLLLLVLVLVVTSQTVQPVAVVLVIVFLWIYGRLHLALGHCEEIFHFLLAERHYSHP